MSPIPARLGTWDYVTFIILIVIASCIGVYHIFAARKSKNTREFLIKSKDLGIFPLVLSAAATFMSAIGLLGFPVETYSNGVSFMVVCFSYILLVPFGTYLYLPVFYNLGVSSIYQYLEIRFNRGLRLCASALSSLQLVLYTSCVMFAPALALNQVTGLHLWASVASIGVICIIYTSMGGIKAVVWADVTQILVMAVVLLVILFKGAANLGGIAEVWRICTEGHRTQFFIFGNSPDSMFNFWSLTIGGTVHYLGVMSTNQLLMQRYVCNPTLRDAKISFIGSAIAISFLTAVCSIGGLIMYARYHDCDPLMNGQVMSRDQIMALFAMETLGFCEGFPGIFVAAILCATLSTLSSSLNSLSAITMEDYIKPYNPHLSDKTEMRLSKIIAMIYGVVCIACVLFAQNISGLIKAVFTIYGVTGGPVLAIFTMGMALPWVNSWGAISGFFAGLLLSGWASVGNMILNPPMQTAPFSSSGCNISDSFNVSQSYERMFDSTEATVQMAEPEVFALYTIPSIWYASWGCSIGCVVAMIVSLLTGPQNPDELDPKLVFPCIRWLVRRLPKKHQEYLGFKLEKNAYLQVTMHDPDNALHQQLNLNKPQADVKPEKPETQILNDSKITTERRKSPTDF